METFTNVVPALKKIFKAQIFMLIGNILFYASLIGLTVISTALLLAGLSDTDAGVIAMLAGGMGVAYIVFIVLLIVGLVFMIIGYINNLIGLRRGGKDEDGYNTAFWCILFALIVTVVSVVLELIFFATAADDIAYVISEVMKVLGIVFVIQSTQVVLVKNDQTEYALKGNNAVFFVIIPYVLAIIARIITCFTLSPTVNLIVLIIALICSIVGYILYLIFLKKSSNILAKAFAAEAAPVEEKAE